MFDELQMYHLRRKGGLNENHSRNRGIDADAGSLARAEGVDPLQQLAEVYDVRFLVLLP